MTFLEVHCCPKKLDEISFLVPFLLCLGYRTISQRTRSIDWAALSGSIEQSESLIIFHGIALNFSTVATLLTRRPQLQ